MRRRALSSLASLVLLLGCAEEIDLCDPGEGEDPTGNCVPLTGMDSGRADGGDDDAGVDSGVDGGDPCVPSCDADQYCVAGECVECRTSADCDDPGAARCGAMGACEPCGGPDDCARFSTRTPPLTVCDGTLATPTCVECVNDTTCGGATPRCADRSCRACTPSTQAMDCGSTACDPRAFTCTGIPRSSLGVCEACVSDDECGAGLYCVETDWTPEMGTPEPAGSFCLRPQGAMPSCITLRGTPRVVVADSLGGMMGTIPGPFCQPATETTCTAALDFVNATPGQCEAGMDQCGVVGLPDGVCEDPPGLCTHRCSNAPDCFGASNTCPPGTGLCTRP